MRGFAESLGGRPCWYLRQCCQENNHLSSKRRSLRNLPELLDAISDCVRPAGCLSPGCTRGLQASAQIGGRDPPQIRQQPAGIIERPRARPRQFFPLIPHWRTSRPPPPPKSPLLPPKPRHSPA